jgi:hypothetical protein
MDNQAGWDYDGVTELVPLELPDDVNDEAAARGEGEYLDNFYGKGI